ncbi:DUF3604 domain-containing protein [Oceanicoccus sagamiensis]|uniref:DUF3604 domain-containing protein n=1 Tax=Oceanicoccus sagamiensis TaxID=716816 RepID=A0A1X9NHV3_9GAMM|nr:DUF3604 domain-containing protein [Oceanicoccus sagamiensis]ARN74487.1 hypothetical protein BST96_10380 [Oceanicoccus sagamiensis]
MTLLPCSNYKAALVLPLLILAGCGNNDPSLTPANNLKDLPSQPAPAEVPYDANRQAYFGDLHIHTGLSTDAYILGVRTEPVDVYKFAKGKVIEHAAGYPIQITRPLDFAAVTDHAEYMGQARLAEIDIPTTQKTLAEILKTGNVFSITAAWLQSSQEIPEHGFAPNGEAINRTVNKNAWQQTIDAAEEHYQPGLFTTFIGYEWSANAGDITAHLHRNVIYRNNLVSDLPYSSLDSHNPEDLWAFLDKENQQGKVAMSIPHNGNFSRGYMYASADFAGKPLTKEYADMRMRYEPISEVVQIKGSSETHPVLSSEDDFADFELLGESLFTQGSLPTSYKGSYVRDALRMGMEFSHNEGFNPFKFGVIGASDSHNASSPTEESDYTGKLPMLDGSAGLRTGKSLLLPNSMNPVTRWSSGGLAGVWAESNTRESLYDALQRKETFATSGPRILVRFFGGWDFTEQQLAQEDMVSQAYANGVPMGGDLTQAPTGKAPSFLIMTMKDPQGANLDRAQVIKAWLDSEGVSQEQVFDIAAADQRQLDPKTNKLPAVGNTVNIDEPSYSNTIGGSSILAFWQDPDFNPQQEAFYYVRVLEIPTPRWSTYDAAKLGTTPMEPTTIQERAITSAIWYKP